MILQRYKPNLNYFAPAAATSTGYFVYWQNAPATAATLDFSDMFIQDTTNKWLLAFYEQAPNLDTLNTSTLDYTITSGASGVLVWIDNFVTTSPSYRDSNHIVLNGAVVTSSFLNFKTGTNAVAGFFFLYTDNATLSLPAAAADFTLTPPATGPFEWHINQGVCQFGQLQIGLTNNTGLLNFESAYSSTHAIPVTTAYIPKTLYTTFQSDATVEPVTPYHFFNAEDLADFTLQAAFSPLYSSDRSTFSLSRTSNPGIPVPSNILDEKGSRLTTLDFSSLTFYLARIVLDTSYPNHTRFVMMPQGSITLAKNANTNTLLGYSGTESAAWTASSLSLAFNQVTGKILVDDTENYQPGQLLGDVNGSPTTQISFATEYGYNLDSEKSPLFDNANIAFTTGVNREVPYTQVAKGTISGAANLPLIPTLAFNIVNPNLDSSVIPSLIQSLIRVDTVLARYRLGLLTQTSATAAIAITANPAIAAASATATPTQHITPQGFKRSTATNSTTGATTNGYDLIASPTPGIQFSLSAIDSNLDLSLRQDDVFLVLTPSLFATYLQAFPNATLNVKFAVNQSTDPNSVFQVDLSTIFTNNTASAPQDKAIIIIKFKKGKSADLLNDITQWTNWGPVLGNTTTLQAIQATITGLNISQIQDTYFHKTVLADPNWNGVFLLNIPIVPGDLPAIIAGLASSQSTSQYPNPQATSGSLLQFQTGLFFQYVAFPMNKTGINPSSQLVDISSTSFYGLINYDLLAGGPASTDFTTAETWLTPPLNDTTDYRFLLTLLRVQFSNSQITSFNSTAYVLVPRLFDDSISGFTIPLAYDNSSSPINNLVRLTGTYQRNSNSDEFNFSAEVDATIQFPANALISSIDITRFGFSVVNYIGANQAGNTFRFDMDVSVIFINSMLGFDIFSNGAFAFQNIGLSFTISISPSNTPNIPVPSLDLSRLRFIPNINFDGSGLLSSFPLHFSGFRNLQIPVISVPGGGFDFAMPTSDFFNIKWVKPTLPSDDPWWKPAKSFANLFGLIFDFDLGTLGNLAGLQGLKGQLLLGWGFKGGFALGFKLDSASSDGLHLDLFGALKLDIQQLAFAQFTPPGATSCSAYCLLLKNVRLTIFGLQLPSADNTFNGVIFAQPGSKIAWLIDYDDNTTDQLVLALGQRVGPNTQRVDNTMDAITDVRSIFTTNFSTLTFCPPPAGFSLPYHPERDWLIASEKIIPDGWPVDLKFIFNDPSLYSLYLALFPDGDDSLFSIDILYKKLSDNLGEWSMDIQLPDEIRTINLGAVLLRLPNIGISISSDGDWKGDIGFPNGDDWSRSGFIQFDTVPPFVGWFGFYLEETKIISETLFSQYIPVSQQGNLLFVQAGFAFRVGIGAYIDGGIFYIGASISFYAILQGSFAFDRTKPATTMLFPTCYAVLGQVGAIAELIGYVDLIFLKASIHIVLQVEFGLLLVYIGSPNYGVPEGLQPVIVYIEGEVSVSVDFTLFCVSFFGSHWCLVIHLSFSAHVRFQYTIGGSSNSSTASAAVAAINAPAALAASAMPAPAINSAAPAVTLPATFLLDLSATTIPIAYIPALTWTIEGAGPTNVYLVHQFVIPFFGAQLDSSGNLVCSADNILIRILIKCLSDLITAMTPVATDYVTIKSILQSGYYIEPVTKAQINTSISVKYNPSFVRGLNDGDLAANNNAKQDTILKNLFHFSPAEITSFNQFTQSNPCNNPDPTTSTCPFRVIPAPISSNCRYIDPLNLDASGNPSVLFSSTGKLSLTLTNLVSDNSNNYTLTQNFVRNPNYTAAATTLLSDAFDSYKTQFEADSSGAAATANATTLQDLREDIIVPEFFSVLLLITLDYFYNDTDPATGNNKSTIAWNPILQPLDSLNDKTIKYLTAAGETTVNSWANLNTYLEKIIGQLNYYYNNGLRLPDFQNGNAYKSYFDLSRQVYGDSDNVPAAAPVSINTTPVAPPPDYSTVSLVLGNGTQTQDITTDTFGTGNALQTSVSNIRNYLTGFGAGFNFTALTREFGAFAVTAPFGLVDVSLTVSDTNITLTDNTTNPATTQGFFALPQKLSQHGLGSYTLRFNCALYKNDQLVGSTAPPASSPTPVTQLNATYCLNISIQVRPTLTTINGATTVTAVEIANVHAQDLALISLLQAANPAIAAIDLYFQPGAADASNNIDLSRVISNKATILKTDLSTRTAPPIITAPNAAPAVTALNTTTPPPTYWEDSNGNLPHFILLLTEALVCNTDGYYLLLDKDISSLLPASTRTPGIPDVNQLSTLVVSFELPAGAAIPDYFNYCRLDSASMSFLQSQKGGDTQIHLYTDQIAVGGATIQEYYSKIPAHCMGFQLLRDRSANAANANYSHYLPVDFQLNNTTANTVVLGRDNVLPLMPANQKDQSGNNIPNKLTYTHITPLIADNPNNLARYSAVGSSFTIDCGLRDTYGFRAVGSIGSPNGYTHYYFDKLISPDAWPLVGLFVWLDPNIANSSLQQISWTLTSQTSFTDLLDLAKVPRNNDGSYKYQPGATISDATDLGHIRSVLPNILSHLYTITAQLEAGNNRVQVSIPGLNTDAKTFLLAHLTNLVNALIKLDPNSSGPMILPANLVATAYIDLNVSGLTQTLKQQLAFTLTIQRTPSDCIDQALFPNPNAPGSNIPAVYLDTATNTQVPAASLTASRQTIWGYDAVISVSSTLRLCQASSGSATTTPVANPQTSLDLLNTALRSLKPLLVNNQPQYSLGLSIDSDGNSLIYLIHEGLLSALSVNPNDVSANAFNNSCYFGIIPYSNSLWSGTYSWQGQQQYNQSFTNVDLDKALQAVLDQVDTFLQASSVALTIATDPNAATDPGHTQLKALYDKLIAAKASLVAVELQNKLEWVMAPPVTPPPANDLMYSEFANLLLDQLDNFYRYDGVIRTTLPSLSLPAGHRLNVSVGVQDSYGLVSGKIGFSNGAPNNQWIITFAPQGAPTQDVSFNINPVITHLEYNIQGIPGFPAIEESTWIQLLTPVPWSNQYTLGQDWGYIDRVYPPKPVILTNTFTQGTLDAAGNTWSVALGKWTYMLGLDPDSGYVDGDSIYIDIAYKTIGGGAAIEALDTGVDFKAFIAWWGTAITKAPLSLNSPRGTDFVTQLSAAVTPAAGAALSFETLATPPIAFKVHRNNGQWNVVTNGNANLFLADINGAPLTVGALVSLGSLSFAGPNIFASPNIVSLQPSIWVTRNEFATNQNFVYQTDPVSPPSWVTPHIAFNNPIVQTGTLQQVLNALPPILPFKATAKFIVLAGNISDIQPFVPVRHLEYGYDGTTGSVGKPADIDASFSGYTNGYASIAMIVYSSNGDASADLPVFSADAIYNANPQ